ncbi:MAG TPA: prepilin-type N-terminal cleavage/methylation domain-containing protein [Archangium sp.]|jgi:prepilin-type N-terminal cleavage/methylation domain-containing protein|uniref:prepilin-type N-terminal cleavage/methylation domain-containing protein n=1 Tax=Archangium sp. TaxID=1872627 RepID=UPI002ED79B5C
MKRTHRNAGFSLVEMSTAVGIVAILAALSYAALEVLPQRTRLTGGALEFSAVLSSARSHAYGRNERVAVLLNADGPNAGQPIRYWVLVDSWSNLQEAMKSTPGWQDASVNLTPPPPAASGSAYRLIDSGHFNPSVRVLAGGYKAAVGSVAHPGCTGPLGSKIGLAQGPTTGSDTFPPPFCFVPNDKPCTFCSGDGSALNPFRGAVFFEPDGTVVFYDGAGNASVDGAGSITFLPVGGGGIRTSQAVVITNTGIVRTFSASR